MRPTRVAARYALPAQSLHLAFPPGETLGQYRALQIACPATHVTGRLNHHNGGRHGHLSTQHVPTMFRKLQQV